MRTARLLKAVVIWSALGMLMLAVIACEDSPASPAPTAVQPTAEARLTPEQAIPEIKRPSPPPTPTLEERKFQLPTDFGNNTKTIADDIHVWYAPTCPPVPPATFVAPIILTHLGSDSYSHLHLNRDGSVKDVKVPDSPTDEARERFAQVLQDSSLMEQILTFPECP